MKPYIQRNLKLTKKQLELVNTWTARMNADSKALFLHLLAVQKQFRFKADYETWEGAPLPRKSFIHVHCRNYVWEYIQPFCTRKPYSTEEGICFRYRIHDELIEEFIAAGAEVLLHARFLDNDIFYDVLGQPIKKLIKPKDKSNNVTQIDIGYAQKWLRRERDYVLRIDNAEEKEKAYRKYLHNLSCFQGMMERLVWINYKKKQAGYWQELIQPDEGLRLYELGGGLQCASKNFREYCLCSSPVINVDVVKCHATIAYHEMHKAGIDPHLDDLLNNNMAVTGLKLAASTIKTALLALLNGARLIAKPNPRFTIPRLVLEDPNMVDATPQEIKVELRALKNLLQKNATAITKWTKTIPKHNRIAHISAFLQSIEVDSLGELKAKSVNDQHDGALIHKDQIINDTGYLQVVPKPISQPDSRFSETVNGKQYEFISFHADEDGEPKNMVDIIMATGDRLKAQQQAANPTPRPHKNTNDTPKSGGGLDLSWLFK